MDGIKGIRSSDEEAPNFLISKDILGHKCCFFREARRGRVTFTDFETGRYIQMTICWSNINRFLKKLVSNKTEDCPL